jgi:hypothetical protein
VRERQRVKAPRWVYLDGDEVVAGRGSGEPWRARNGIARRGYGGGQG